ncbi:MAG: hypothetical protein ACYSWO_20300 [Planctomycetota bacterium]|jgi:hypothetical protein
MVIREIVLALILLGMHGSQLMSAVAGTDEIWRAVLHVTKEERTEESHSKTWIDFRLMCGPYAAFVGYEERVRILGSRNPTAKETVFAKSVEITQKEADAFMSQLEKVGFLELPESKRPSSNRRDSNWSEELAFHSGEKKIERRYEYPPTGGIRSRIHEIIFSYIDEMDLDDPDEPLRIEVFVKGEPGSMLSLELSEPLWNPVYYHGKIIESMKVNEVQGSRKAVITLADDSGQVVGTWNATIPDDELASYDGKAAYEGNAIDWIGVDTRVTLTEGDLEPSRKVTLQEILEEPDKFHGKRICTKGFYDFQFEGMDFHDRRGSNVWIGENSSFARKKRATFPFLSLEGLLLGRLRGYATVEGVFLKGPGGHFGLWPGEIVRLTRCDAHFKLDYIFWAILVSVALAGVFVGRRIKKRIPSTASGRTNDPPEIETG